MGNIYRNQRLDCDGKTYYKSTSGLWLEMSHKDEKKMYSEKSEMVLCAKKRWKSFGVRYGISK